MVVLAVHIDNQIADFIHYHQTPEERFQRLPPGIARDRKLPQDVSQARRRFRSAQHQPADEPPRLR